MKKMTKSDGGSSPQPPGQVSTAPDGGWGWVVVFSSFWISFIADGVGYTFGIVKTELDAHFEVASSTTAWAGSLLGGVPLLIGALAVFSTLS